jgi:hypothetical protein
MDHGELAALLAIDALEPEEQVDAELRFGTWPMPLAEATLPLAESVAASAPPDLAFDVLAAARARRTPGRPVVRVDLVTPAQAFATTLREFHELLVSLSDTEATLAAHEEHGRVRDLVAHLVGVEQLNLRWLNPDEQVPYLPDHVASTRETVARLAELPFAEVVHEWRESALAMLASASRSEPARQIPFHDISVSVDGLLTMRTFELWAHGMDIALATDRPLPMLDDERMLLMSSRLMVALPAALLYRSVPVPGRSARFVLTGPAGGCYDVTFDVAATPGDVPDPDVTIVADVVDLCRVAAARLSSGELAVTVEGDEALAKLVLSHMDAFARD